MDTYMVISTDSHAGPPNEEYRDYVDPEFREAFDRCAARGTQLRPLKDIGVVPESYEQWIQSIRGAWNATERLEVLDADGIVAEILLSNSLHHCHPPFGAGVNFPQSRVDGEQQWAGARAHNRWLAQFCAEAPERFIGIALIPLAFGVDAAVAEVTAAAARGLRGVAIPSLVTAAENYHHRRYDAFWQACQDLNMTIVLHSGAVPLEDYYGAEWMNSKGDFVGGLCIHLTEVMYWAYRPLIFLIWGGVLERYPRLRVVVTEVGDLRQLQNMLRTMDGPYGAAEGDIKDRRSHLSMPPSDYFRRNVRISGFCFDIRDTDVSRAIGIGNLLWGSDYPHVEGTWPRTKELQRLAFMGLPESDIAAVLGENAIECFGLQQQREQLTALAARIGPKRKDFVAAS
jgi:predicted TIM-barrel fold metal-dependent hydrolase